MAARDKLQKQKQKNKKKKEWFIREKMWLSYLLSNFTKDVGKIPRDIGNNILMANNMYISSLYLSSMIQVKSISPITPVTLVGELNRALRDDKINALIDVTVKSSEFIVQLNDSGLKSRIDLWQKQLVSELSTKSQLEKAALCLNTVDVAKAGNRLYKSKISITLRAKNRTNLQKAEDCILKYSQTMQWEVEKVIDVKRRLRYMSLISDCRDAEIRDIPSVVTSNTILSQLFVNGSSYNDKNGIFMGVNIKTNSQFRLDLNSITVARNMYCVAPSGVGKTVITQRMCESAIEYGMNCCIMDIKGNEFIAFTESNGGVVLSMRNKSKEYINSFVMHKSEATDSTAEFYFKDRLEFSKRQMMILINIAPKDEQELEDFLEEFLYAVYTSMGVLSSNRNTWDSTLSLNPYIIYDKLYKYVTKVIDNKYSNTALKAVNTLKTYMSPSGSKSYIFEKELNYKDVLNCKVLTFCFGILENANLDVIDMNIFRLKFAYMNKINSEYVTNMYNKGIKVFKVLEESQIVDDNIMQDYVKEYTLRRAQGQTTLLLGNSVQALLNSHIARPLVENTRAILIGQLPTDAREVAIKEFGLEDYRYEITTLGTTEETENSFLFINKMQPRPLDPILKVILEKKRKYRLHTPTRMGDEEEEE